MPNFTTTCRSPACRTKVDHHIVEWTDVGTSQLTKTEHRDPLNAWTASVDGFAGDLMTLDRDESGFQAQDRERGCVAVQ